MQKQVTIDPTSKEISVIDASQNPTVYSGSIENLKEQINVTQNDIAILNEQKAVAQARLSDLQDTLTKIRAKATADGVTIE